MPRIKSYAPGWLNQPSPGHKLFEAPVDDSKLPAALAYAKQSKPGLRRTIARRGTEIFVAAGKQIRWGDLAQLKEGWESRRAGSAPRSRRQESEASFEIYDEEAGRNGQAGSASVGGYRTLKTPVADDIRQLVMSPNQDYLAVLTSHTVHICLLPDSSHLHSRDSTPFKSKFFTLGPTTHVTTRSPVVSAIWHPLGVSGTCIVTVTEDAVVRVFELSPTDHWSFDSPTLSIDLKKLADGTSLDQDFGASTSTTNKAFSPDMFDMEVAAACMPDRGSGGWSSMTLWLAMVGGDVYALCPLLPQRWSPPPTLIPSLSISVVQNIAAIEDDPEVSPGAKILAQQQFEWISELDNQEPKVVENPFDEGSSDVYTRPSRPGTVPRLQGPFQLDLNPDDEQDDEVELKDIHVIGQRINTTDLMMGEEDEVDLGEMDQEGLSLSVVCLLSTTGQVKICLDMEGVQAQWLPPRDRIKARRLALSAPTASLLTFQTFDTVKPGELTADSWPMFSEDITSRYAFYVTHSAGITHVSLAPWVFRLERELESESAAGAEFRIELLVKGQGCERDRIYTQQPGQNALVAATAFRDPDLGHFVLSATNNDPIALFFDTPEALLTPAAAESPEVLVGPDEPREPQPIWDPRPLFHPSDRLGKSSSIPAWYEHVKTGRRRPILQQEIRLSVASLELFTEGHQIVSSEVFELNNAVAELFRKCEALHSELRLQVIKANTVKRMVDEVTGADEDEDDPISYDMMVKSRLDQAQRKQEQLNKRMESLKRRMGRATSRGLSDKEKAWIEEVQTMERNLLGPYAEAGAEEVLPATPGGAAKGTKEVWKRVEEIKKLKESLLAQAEQLQRRTGGESGSNTGAASPSTPNLKIPADIRRAKVAQVMNLLDRETALVDAVKSRLERLTFG
ncbi:hypothetical protein QBC37DRAFT_473837 [Rhypophila decipiens]|uniref:Nucleoporin NUP82 n=1 Tax=Rhypophila decipiens TaxID=261697 RepID=A0AAN6Y4C8_9PEZI|nr:hypothetical protein QBC37DRAFT_473837 [Rhypophila decipiens]